MSFTTQHQFNIKLINPSMLPVSLAVLPQKSHKRLLYGQTAFFSYIYYADRILTKAMPVINLFLPGYTTTIAL